MPMYHVVVVRISTTWAGNDPYNNAQPTAGGLQVQSPETEAEREGERERDRETDRERERERDTERRGEGTREVRDKAIM